MRSAVAIASIAPSTSERETLRAVSSTLTWSAATACSNGVWSSENSGAASRTRSGASPRCGGGGGTPRARPPAAPGSPRSRAPARTARRSTRTCWRAARAPRRCGRRPRRDGRRRTARRPSASARTRRSATRCRRRVSGGPRAAGGIVAVLGMAERLSTVGLVTSCPVVMERLPTRLDGSVLLAPAVHGDERGFFMETFRADAWAAHGVPTEFVQDNHSRSRRGTLRGIHFQTAPGPGQARPRRARQRCSTSSSTCGAARRRSASGRRFELDDERGLQLCDPGRLRPRLLRALRRRGLRLQVHELLRPGDRGGLPLRRSRRRHRVAGRRAALLRARPHAPRLAEIADELPFPCERRRPLRAEPDRHAAPRQPAHRAAGVAVRALGRRRASSCGWRTSTPAACGPGVGRAAARRPGRDRARLGRRGRVPVGTRLDRYAEAIERAARRRPRVRVLLHARRDPRGRLGAARPAARGRLSRARACG